ncbi:glycosyltransferase [Longimicrobium sp.]|uniref:glycosyltransferase n=1 Tax=Longimicrobium sp. TaxID=2029185 RepID=UPI002CE275A5|nr:glycosyltransferase [Longimicrobium sp.]HSU15221.1 glycosyltransferase [Longimicrobium sp.]
MTLPDAPPPPPSLTVGVATKDRPEALVRCLRSLRLLDGLLAEAIVVDDASDPPVEGAVTAALAADLPPEVRFIRNERSVNVAAGRNRIAREARTPWVLNLDDDAFVVTREAVEQAVRVLETDPEVAAIAFPQCDEAGVPYAPSAQPAPVDYPCYAPTFIGYAHLLRRDAFLSVGGFRERLGINGEEKDLCLRMLDEGWRVVYLPSAGVGHVAAAAGRDRRRYLHQTVRNSVVSAFCDEPMPLMPAGVAVRLWRYFPMRKGWGIDDPGGFGRIVRGLARDLPALMRERRPVRWETMRRWRSMTQSPPEPYRGPAVTAGPDA